MHRRAFLLLFLIVSSAAIAQEGHPLTGTWSGDWGPSAGPRTHVTLVMSWDGKTVSGTLNPGENGTPIPNISLDVTNWAVRFEADAKDAQGKPVHVAVDGKIDDLSSAHRKLIGTWTQGATKGDFKLTRD